MLSAPHSVSVCARVCSSYPYFCPVSCPDASSFSFIHAGGSAPEERDMGIIAGIGAGIATTKVMSHIEQLETDHFMAHMR